MITPGALQTLRTELPASGWVPTVPNGNRLQGNFSALVRTQRGSEVPSKEGEEGAALPGAARHLCRSHITTEAPPDSKMGPCWVCSVLDLYCGAGTIGLSMANKAKNIIGVEIIPEAVEDAKFNAQNNNLANAQFICGDAKDAARTLADKNIKPDVVVVDPPRKGCSEELLCIIAKDFAPEKLVYVSCDPATLARDVNILSSLGYNLLEYTPFDLFPRTSHCECCALFGRN